MSTYHINISGYFETDIAAPAITTTNAPPVETCPCCGGTKKQMRKDGIWILCPACDGRGVMILPPVSRSM